MEAYLDPIKTAFISFPLAAFLLTIPFSIVQYRKHGYVNKWRSFILFSFLLYAMNAYYLVIMPLPESRDILSIQKPGTVHYNLRPFQFIRDIASETRVDLMDPSTYGRFLRERAFLQAAFNALLLLPLGFYLNYYFKRSFKETLVIGFLSSLFFELTQLSGLYGIYNAPYRLFDIDDLFLNTLGALIGYGLSPIFKVFLPRTEDLDRKAGAKKYRISFFRRWLAFFIDTSLVRALMMVFPRPYTKYLGLSLFLVLIPSLTSGYSIGSFLANIRIVGKEDKLRPSNIIVRFLSLYIGLYGINNILFKVFDTVNMKYALYTGAVLIVMAVWNLLIFSNMILAIVRSRPFFYEEISRTRLIVGKIREED